MCFGEENGMFNRNLKHANLKFLNYSVGKKRDFLKIRLERKKELLEAVPVHFNLSEQYAISHMRTIRHPGESGRPVPWLISRRTVWLVEITLKLILIPRWTRRGERATDILVFQGHGSTRYTGLPSFPEDTAALDLALPFHLCSSLFHTIHLPLQ